MNLNNLLRKLGLREVLTDLVINEIVESRQKSMGLRDEAAEILGTGGCVHMREIILTKNGFVNRCFLCGSDAPEIEFSPETF